MNFKNFWIIPGLNMILIMQKKLLQKSTTLFNVNIESKTRQRNIADLRMIAIYLIRKNTKLSSAEIGKIIDKDHATILHACKEVQNQIKINPAFRKKYETIINNNEDIVGTKKNTNSLLNSYSTNNTII